MSKVQPIRVVVVRNHVRLVFGQTIMHSEEYSSPAGARRAAKNLVKAINTRPMQLEYALRGVWQRVVVRTMWWVQSHGNIALPVVADPPPTVSVRGTRE